MRRDEDRARAVYAISVAAELAGMHPQTLRLYERRGLIRPARSGSNVRLYSEWEVERLRQIRRLTQDLGVNLAGVEVILDLLSKIDEMRTEIEQLRKLVRGQVEQGVGSRE